MSTEDSQQTLTEHLADLRTRIINILLILFIGTVICWSVSEHIFEIIRVPIAPYLNTSDGGLVYTGVTDKFMAHVKISMMSSVILTAPFWFYQVWLFVAPGLYRDEKKYALTFITSGVLLFLLGVLFVYYFVFPMAFQFLFAFGGTTDKPLITIGEYLSFFTMTTLLFGLCFELPLVIAILGMLGLVDQKFLRKNRRYAIVALSAVAAVVTPPDLMSMVFLLLPLVGLYELSIVLVGFLQKPKAAA